MISARFTYDGGHSSHAEITVYLVSRRGVHGTYDGGHFSYRYYGMNTPCWAAGAKRHVAAIESFKDVPANSSSQLAAAVAQQPVSVGICAGPMMSYKSGIFDDAKKCDCEVDHGVLVVGFTPEAWIVKNSWGADWGERGYIRMARNATNPGGICNIYTQASYPLAKPSPLSPLHLPSISRLSTRRRPTRSPSPPLYLPSISLLSPVYLHAGVLPTRQARRGASGAASDSATTAQRSPEPSLNLP